VLRVRPPDSTVCIAEEKRFSNQKNSSVSNWSALHIFTMFPSSRVGVVHSSCCYGNRFVVIDAMLLLMPLAMLLSMPVVMLMVLPLALDSVSCMRKRYPFISARAIGRDRSSVVIFTACVAVGNVIDNGVANRVVNCVDGASIMIYVFSKTGFSCFRR